MGVNKLFFTPSYIQIKCDRNDLETKLLCNQLPYAHRNRIDTEFYTSPRYILQVLKLFRGIDYSIPDAKVLDFMENGPKSLLALVDREINRQIATKTLIELGPDNEHEWLWKHQQLGRELAQVNNKWAFFYDTRTGKTPMSLHIIKDDLEINPHHKWLVLCPLILIENAWLPDAESMFPGLSVVSLHAATRAGREKRFAMNANVYVCNTESFVSYLPYIQRLGIHGCILDESSVMKNASSKFSKAAVEFATSIKRWYLLSGTPAPNGEWEYYRQLQSIDYYGVHQSNAQFKAYFFNNTSRNPQFEKLVVKEERQQELLQLLRNYSLYVDKEDVLKTPGRDFNEISIELPKDLQEKYKELKGKLAVELSSGVNIVSPSHVANLNKLNQVSSGFLIDTEAIKNNNMLRKNSIKEGFMEESHLLSLYRFEHLYNLLDTFGNKQAIIWCTYRKEFEIIKEQLGDRCGLVYGGVNINEKNANIKAFKEGKIQFLIANPASADKGLTLTNAHIAVYFSLNYSYELWKQSLERIYGDITKQPNRCVIYTFIAKNTIDAILYNTVRNKGDMSAAVLEYLKGSV